MYSVHIRHQFCFTMINWWLRRADEGGLDTLNVKLKLIYTYTVWVKKIPPKVFWHFSQTVGNFLTKFYTCVVRSYIRSTTNFYLIICNFDKVMPYCTRPPSSHHTRKMSTIGRNERWHFLTFSPNSWEFLVQILHTYYVFLCTLDYKFLLNYLQLWWSYAVLSATTQRAFRSMVNILSVWWWSCLIWHNFVKVADNWIKIGSLV